jgi:hypothetical protein
LFLFSCAAVKVRLFRKASNGASTLLSSTDYVRLQHPETGGFVQASSNSDKGRVLDFAEGAFEPDQGGARSETLLREGGGAVHVPYLKAGAQAGGQLSAKGVWTFELLDRAASGPVLWRSPLRVRHVPSGKYLAVDSTKPSKRPTWRTNKVNSGEEDEASLAELMFDAGLVALCVNPSLPPGALGSPASTVFYLMPSEVPDTASLAKSIVTVRLEHRPPPKSEAFEAAQATNQRGPATLYLVAPKGEAKPPVVGAPELSPELISLELNEGDDQAEKGGSALHAAKAAASHRTTKGLRLLFGVKLSADDALKVVAVPDAESRALDGCVSRVAPLRLYAHVALAHDGNDGDLAKRLAEQMAVTCMRILKDVAKGGVLADGGSRTPDELLKLAVAAQGLGTRASCWALSLLLKEISSFSPLLSISLRRHGLDVYVARAQAPHSVARSPGRTRGGLRARRSLQRRPRPVQPRRRPQAFRPQRL